MIAALKKAYANFRGFDLTHSAVPPMEGPLRPNTRLDAMPVALALDGIDNLVRFGEVMMCSSGMRLITLSRAGQTLNAVEAAEQPAPISCLASDGSDALAVGLDGSGIVIRGGKHDGRTIDRLGDAAFSCPTSALFVDPDTLVVANGSSRHNAADWKRDLMSQGSTGSVWIVDLAATGGAAVTRLAENLAWPSGISLKRDGSFFVSEAWRHRVLSIERKGGAPSVALADLPAYPGRIETAMAGGFWLALFAPRNPMVEFVLLEKEYRRRMMETIDPEYWIAPNLAPSKSYLQPIQGGARKMLNRLKPWSPTWSYGLVCYCDAGMRPRWSMHSRADGHVHGITTLCEWDGTLFAGAKGSGVVVVAPILETDGLVA
ncbi:hypothetical protein [Shinella pollutisoli]|uniref:Strictosidine synthase n=1 Tax=Shinella pollutisoli TaxID=2250594 RepID=A0ABV7DKB0_9HYPH|nr:hypothetical protein [Shinella pollutisoli]